MALQLIEIADIIVASPQASITFSSIPSGYTDLVLKSSVRNSSGFRNLVIQFNGSSANFTFRTLNGNGSSVVSDSYSNFGFNSFGYAPLQGTDTTNTFSNSELYIPNYAGSTNKSSSLDTVSENNGTTAYAYLQAGLWSQTAAITSLTISPFSGNFEPNSTATLYGVL